MSVAVSPEQMSYSPRKFADVPPISLDLVLPWQPSEKEEKRFKRILIGFIVAMLALLLVFAFSPVTERPKEEKIVAKTQILLKPIPEEKPPEPEPEKPKVEPKVEKPPEPAVAKKKTEAKTQKPKPTEKNTPVSDGLNDVSNQLSALRASFDLSRNTKKNVTDSSLGKKAKTARTTFGKDNVTKKSDGIKVDNTAMLDQHTTLAAHNTASVEGLKQAGVEGGSPVSRYATHMSGERTMDSIRYTLEKNKGGIFTLYHRALSKTPGLNGKYTFELVIEPNGTISSLKLLSSELSDSQLNKDILNRIKSIRFKQEDVIVARVKYTYNFIES